MYGSVVSSTDAGEQVLVEDALASPSSTSTDGLSKALDARHLTLIAIGGTIGTGMFVGSGATIAIAGPAGALLAFLICSVLVFLVTTALGEMATFRPSSGSFSTYASRFVDPAFGFTLGWNYWLQWAISLPSEISAASLIMSYWFPDFPSFIWSLLILLILLTINIIGVRGFGETEYWLSMVKVSTVVIFIGVGTLVDLGYLGSNPPIYLDNWRIEGAPFKNGLPGIINVFVIAFFSFGGTELVGVTAAETRNPGVNVPRAVNQTFWRLLLFYVVSVFVIGLCLRNDDPNLLDAANSNDVAIAPFTLVFERAGLRSAAHLMNGVIMSAVFSAGNSAMYAASRTLLSLAEASQAPNFLSYISPGGIPLPALLFTSLISFLCLSLSLFITSATLFTTLLSLTGVSGILTWISICLIHIRFRGALNHQRKAMPVYMAPFGVAGDFVAIALGLAVLIGEGYVAFLGDKEGRRLQTVIAVYAGVPLFVGLWIGYKLLRKTKLVPLEQVDFDRVDHWGVREVDDSGRDDLETSALIR
ncbi:amino acid permease/ SLC12A domain-containing protein [Cladochytrium replicatum]|nr:amino acid permease/ SLC12A domain-containing protein [Cladochytrium replicatum]